ncbi:uncharacterized protein [Gossypium hirsutum]|uniref:Phorbol-ester/DAG-type domain-containing protein n=1 Tax=Gossypium hirsutum TaxID=3635 RepID=A0ABM3BF82_GOSHI|nr:uncharacterized protein LOC121225460 [Gossypium hirsutum]
MVEYSDEEYTIQHFTHLHPLKLVDSNQKDEVICSICEELCSSSSSSTYGCMECKFFLHKSCMKSIPQQLINHHIHPCTLIFITYPYGRDECACCGERIVPRMKFSCGACEFDLHVKCALFPTIDSEDAKEIQHFSHSHTLALVQNDEEYGSERRCVACAQICLAPAPTFSGHQHLLTLYEKTADVTCHLCGVNYHNFVLRCVPCDINIHFQCHPSAPETIKYKSHLHPLTLTKSPFEFELNSVKKRRNFIVMFASKKETKES